MLRPLFRIRGQWSVDLDAIAGLQDHEIAEAAEAAAAELRDMNRRASAWIAEVSNAVLTVLGEPLDPPPPPPVATPIARCPAC